jgi:hypothetical protein
MKPDCICCKRPGEYSILLAEGMGAEGEGIRWYIPNQRVREAIGFHDVQREVWFCRSCMRTLEDNFRATIAYLTAEGGSWFAPKRSPTPEA